MRILPAGTDFDGVVERQGWADLGLIRRLADQRRELIYGHARPFLDDGEEILQWVRARRTEGRGNGFLFLTERRAVIAWTARGQGDEAIAWDDVVTWGLNREARGGPVLGIETPDGVHFVQIVASTHKMAAEAMELVRRVADLAPDVKKPFDAHGSLGAFETDGGVALERERRSRLALIRRIAATVLGISLIVVGIAIIPLPGPWSFVINLAGLAILASEYDWAQDLLTWTRRQFEQAREAVAERRRKRRGGRTPG